MASWQKDYARYKGFFLDILRVYRQRPDMQAFLEIILSLAAISIFAAFAIRPTILTILELNKEIKNKEDTTAKLEQKIVNLQTASSILESIGPDLVYLNQAVPTLAEPDEFIKQVEGHATLNSVNILGLAASDVVLAGKVEGGKKSKEIEALPQNAQEVPITLSVTGAYSNLLSFMKNLENLRRPIKIDSISITASETDEGKKIVLVISGRTPYVGDK